MLRNFLYYLLTAALFVAILAGCSGGDELETQLPPELPTGSEDILPSDNDDIRIPETPQRGRAVEIDLGVEEYDYSGWESVPINGLYFLMDREWQCPFLFKIDTDQTFRTVWIDKVGSQIVFRSNVQGVPMPADAVMEIVNDLVEEGVVLEYGDVQIEYPYILAANYYRHVGGVAKNDETENWDAQIFFVYWEGATGTEWTLSLSLAETDNAEDGAISMENFFKLAYSLYFGPDPEEYYYEFTGGLEPPNYCARYEWDGEKWLFDGSPYMMDGSPVRP